MPVKGEKISWQDVKAILGSIPSEELLETERFVKGDHWQQGKGWTGWYPESGSADAMAQFRLVEKLFNPKNVCGGMVKRVRGAVLGKEPDWEIVPKDREKNPLPVATNGNGNPAPKTKDKKFEALDKSLVRWWTEKKVHQKLKDFVSNRSAYGKAGIRIYIPSGYVKPDPQGRLTLTVKDIDDALSKIYVEVPHWGSVVDAPDLEFGQNFTVIENAKNKPEDPSSYEVCYLDENGLTWIRQLKEAGTGQTSNADGMSDVKRSIDLRGNLLTYVAGHYTDAMISPTVKAQQKSVNHAKTGENFALANINFPETTFINANIPTEKKTIDGKLVEVPLPMAAGAGRWRNLVGRVIQNWQGGEEIVKPDVKWRDGADPDKFAKVADNNTRDMHQEAGMLYIYLADSEYASGNSKVESMTDYLILLVDEKTGMDTAGVWLLTTVLRLAMNLSNAGPDEMEGFEVIFSTKLTIGRVSSQDKTLFLDEVAKGLRSKRNYMVVAEVTDDPDSELAVIATDTPLKDNPIEVAKAQADIIAKTQPTNGNGNGSGNGGPKPAPAPAAK